MFFGPSLLIMPCGRCAALPQIGTRRVDQQVEPVDRLLDPRAALGPDRAVVFAARQDRLDGIGQLAPAPAAAPRRQGAAACTGRNRRRGARAGCRPRRYRCGARPAGPSCSRPAAGRGRSRSSALPEIRLPVPCSPIVQPVDLLEAARAVGKEPLPRLRLGSAGERRIPPPRPRRPPAAPYTAAGRARPRDAARPRRPACRPALCRSLWTRPALSM